MGSKCELYNPSMHGMGCVPFLLAPYCPYLAEFLLCSHGSSPVLSPAKCVIIPQFARRRSLSLFEPLIRCGLLLPGPRHLVQKPDPPRRTVSEALSQPIRGREKTGGGLAHAGGCTSLAFYVYQRKTFLVGARTWQGRCREPLPYLGATKQ